MITIKVKLSCGHTVDVSLQGSCPADCNGTFRCPTCDAIECNCKPPQKSNSKPRVAESDKPVTKVNIFRWNGELSDSPLYRKDDGPWYDHCTKEYLKRKGYTYDMICVHCGRSLGKHDYMVRGDGRVCRKTRRRQRRL